MEEVKKEKIKDHRGNIMGRGKMARIDIDLDKAIREYKKQLEKLESTDIPYREASRRYAKDTKPLLDLKPINLDKKETRLFGQL